MATYKSLAMARLAADELKLRLKSLSLDVAESFDSAGNPLVKVGTGVAGAKGGLIRIKSVDTLQKDGIGLAQNVFTPHVVQLLVESNNTAGIGADVQGWDSLLPMIAACLALGAKVELWTTANGDAPDIDDIGVDATLAASWSPHLQYGLMSNQ